MKVLLCGGGNAVHVLASSLPPDCDVNILSLFSDEADRFRKSIPTEQGIRCINDLGNDKYGKPIKISNDPAEVAPGADIVILALPSFCHENYLQQLKPFLKPCVLGAMPGEGAFDIVARHVLGNEFVSKSSLFAAETLPWACRIVDFGKIVEVLGTKKEIDVVITPPLADAKENDTTSTESILSLLQRLIGRKPVLKPACNFLAVTLMNINSVWHPTISYGYYRDKVLSEGFDEPPLFYQGADEFTGQMLENVSNEVLEVKRALLEMYPALDLSSLHHVKEWMLRSYGDDIGDKSSLYKMLLTNKGYRGLTHPMIKVQENGENGEVKYYPNFNYRYFTEDVPMGLVVTRGIAELASVKTPYLDEVLMWCQSKMDKEFLVDGKLCGKDLETTRAPQRFNFKDIDTFMVANHYVEDPNQTINPAA